jgi:GPH family glycoside/pentoside/hexuronide:cation symporter
MLSIYGFEANAVQSVATQTGMKIMMSFIPATGALLSVIFIIFYKLNDALMIDISDELSSRREKDNL